MSIILLTLRKKERKKNWDSDCNDCLFPLFLFIDRREGENTEKKLTGKSRERKRKIDRFRFLQ